MKQVKRKTLAVLTALCVLCAMGAPVFGAEKAANEDISKLGNPQLIKGKPAVWDCVWFGHYPQGSDGNEGFMNEPIKWRVLSVDGDEALLLADQNLDVRKQHGEAVDATWETSVMRKWLNGTDSEDFLGKAFSKNEQTAIYEKTLKHPDNAKFDIKGGNDTKDKIFLLSTDEVKSFDHGFPNYEGYLKNSGALNTDYVKSKGARTNGDGEGEWLLRLPGRSSVTAASVQYGKVDLVDYDTIESTSGEVPIRPALRLNLNSSYWSYAGTVSSDGTVSEKAADLKDKTKPAKKMASPLLDTATWHCVWFGNYPQSSDGNGGFRSEPIKWRVLTVTGDEALLLADKNLDVKKYNEEYTEVTWETSTIRKWLNGTSAEDFLGKAFDSEEQKAILEKTVENPDIEDLRPPLAGTLIEGGNDTQDKVFLLSMDEVKNPTYGFSNSSEWEKTRATANTAYASLAIGAREDKQWWLRSPGYNSTSGSSVSDMGSIVYNGSYAASHIPNVRPALWLDLNSNAWSYAGTVSSDDPLEEPSNAPVSLDHITATKTKTAYKTNEALATNDLIVTAFYSDGSNKAVTDYATNAAAIDMKTAGNKTLEVTYEENGITKKATIQIIVTKADIPPASEPTQQTQGDKKEPKPTKPADKLQKPKTVTLKKVSSTKKGALKLTWKRDAKATGYQAMVATDKKFKKNKKTAVIKKNKTVSKTFTKLKRKKTYYAKVRAYKQAGKTTVYGSYSKVKKAKVK